MLLVHIDVVSVWLCFGAQTNSISSAKVVKKTMRLDTDDRIARQNFTQKCSHAHASDLFTLESAA